MLNLKSIFTKKKSKKNRNYFEMSSGDKVKVLRKAAKKANKEQLDLIKDYESKFGEKVDLSKCRS